MTNLSASIIIPTYNRSQYVRQCLAHVMAQSISPKEIFVVDASSDDATENEVNRFSSVVYIRSHRGRGTTATSRAMGLERASGDIIVYLDDDAYPRADWLEQLLARYAAPDIAGVGGRTTNGQPGEESEGIDQVGKLMPDGSLTGHFAAITGGDIEVDHLLGANMSMRRDVIEQLGGVRDFYPGTCLREESDIALRARAAGYRLIYTPNAVVKHVGGTYAKGQRFDRRYEYYAARNHAVLLYTALGPNDPHTRANTRAAILKGWRYVEYACRSLTARPGGSENRLRGTANGLSRAAVSLAGAFVGNLAARRHLQEIEDKGKREV